MRKLSKFLIIPAAFTCCSMNVNEPTIRFESFGITSEDIEADSLKLMAYIDVLITRSGKVCSFNYSWIDEEGVSHPSGGSSITSVYAREDCPLYGCSSISIKELNKHSSVTFLCEARISGEDPYRISMPYCGNVKEEITINESTNGQELSTGFIKESTYPDHSQDYHYEDTFTFFNYEDLRVNELYYDIDISYLRFKYRNGLDDTLKGEFVFAFYDKYNLFPDFPIGDSLYRYIPLTFNQDHGECYFTFTPTMYYDPKTHECSLIQKEGYLPYHNLMLPFGAWNELEYLPCYIELKVHSHTDFTIKGTFTMTYLLKYFGDMEDSKYYEEIRQDDEVNIREKTIEVTI